MFKIQNICPFKLEESYDTLFELQHRLKITDEYLHTTTRDIKSDNDHHESLITLLDASSKTRDNIITWYLKQSSTQLNATISLLTAKIKFIEYKLGKCEGLDLHQACSLSLVNFCNILADLTVHSSARSERKTMHMVSSETNIPVWLSHYRNQICHVPSESPCIAILVPLVIRALDYMKESFWSKILDRNTFNYERCGKLIKSVFENTTVESINQRVELRRDLKDSFSKKRMRQATQNLSVCAKSIKSIRRMYHKNPDHVTEVISNYLLSHSPLDKSRNCGLLLEQVILARCLEKLIFRLIGTVEENSCDNLAWRWLIALIRVISSRKKDTIKASLKKVGVNISVKMMRLTEIPPVKCVQMAYRISKSRHILAKKLIFKLRNRMKVVLGRDRTKLFLELTRIAKD